jgi:hypothetical protein
LGNFGLSMSLYDDGEADSDSPVAVARPTPDADADSHYLHDHGDIFNMSSMGVSLPFLPHDGILDSSSSPSGLGGSIYRDEPNPHTMITPADHTSSFGSGAVDVGRSSDGEFWTAFGMGSSESGSQALSSVAHSRDGYPTQTIITAPQPKRYVAARVFDNMPSDPNSSSSAQWPDYSLDANDDPRHVPFLGGECLCCFCMWRLQIQLVIIFYLLSCHLRRQALSTPH